MLTISLDEYGDFENVERSKGPIFIAGIIFDDKGIKGETKAERKRIEAYYKKVISESKQGCPSGYENEFVYPSALHSRGGKDRDHYVIRPVKQKVNETIAEYLQKGTYKKERLGVPNNGKIIYRRGEYHIYVIVKSNDGIERLLCDHINMLANDSFASNLYYHMASTIITRLLFHNPVISNVHEVSLNLATRASRTFFDENDELISEYKRLGYKPIKGDNGLYFILTNSDIYRTIISEEMLRTNKEEMSINSFRIRPISYTGNSKDMEFLFLADSICSIIGYNNSTNRKISISEISKDADRLTGTGKNLIFGYDRIDILFSEAWNKLEEEDYYNALSITYGFGLVNSAFVDYYKNHWKKKLENRIHNSNNVAAFSGAVQKLNRSLYTNSLDQDRCLYILRHLEIMGNHLEECFQVAEAKEAMYDLFDAGVSAYCHIGDSIKAEHYFGLCMQYASFVDITKYLNTRNRMVVYYCDFFDFTRALEIADEDVGYQELLFDVRKELFKESSTKTYSIELGKALSQRGQVYAFMRDSNANEDFNGALKLFPKDSANYKTTQSYLLHYYLDNGLKEYYINESIDYFGENKDVSRQIDYIIQEGAKENPLINVKYSMYIMLKGLYYFRPDEITEKIWNQLVDFENRFRHRKKDPAWYMSGHPTELIYKYMNLISLKQNIKRKDDYIDKMKKALPEYGKTVNAILQFGESECADAEEDFNRRDEMTLELCHFLKASFPAFKEMMIGEEDDRWNALKNIFTFMYR